MRSTFSNLSDVGGEELIPLTLSMAKNEDTKMSAGDDNVREKNNAEDEDEDSDATIDEEMEDSLREQNTNSNNYESTVHTQDTQDANQNEVDTNIVDSIMSDRMA